MTEGATSETRQMTQEVPTKARYLADKHRLGVVADCFAIGQIKPVSKNSETENLTRFGGARGRTNMALSSDSSTSP